MFESAESEHPRLTNCIIISKNSNLCDQNPPTLQTDRQTTCVRKMIFAMVYECHSTSIANCVFVQKTGYIPTYSY